MCVYVYMYIHICKYLWSGNNNVIMSDDDDDFGRVYLCTDINLQINIHVCICTYVYTYL